MELNFEDYKIDRVINTLQNGDKFQKKRILKEVEDFFKEGDPASIAIVFNKLLNSISLTFQDKAEICRELAINVCITAIKQLEPDVNFLSSLIPAIHNRICTDCCIEPSEELRLLYADLVCALIESHESVVSPFVEELVEILTKLISDDAPQVKKRSCYTSIQLAEIPMYEFHTNSKKFVAPLIDAMNHQQWRVRVAAIEALEIVVLKGDPKLLPDTANPLAKKLFDDTSHVRMAVTKLVGNWMLNHYDRYSYFSHLLPLILTSLTDCSEDIVKEARMLWEKAGQQYLVENEKDYKDKIDYLEETLEHYPKGVVRPGLGCRILVEREGCKFLLALAKELSDWVVNVRIKSAQLLSQVVLHAEFTITQQLQKIIGAICRAAMDEEAAVVQYVELSCEYMGYFIPPEVYTEVLMDYMKEASCGELRVAACLVRGSRSDQLLPYLSRVTPLLANTTHKAEEQIAILSLIENLFNTCGGDALDIGDSIWAALMGVLGLAASESITSKGLRLLDEMCRLGGGDRRAILTRHCHLLVTSLREAHWTVHCHHQHILIAIVTHAEEVVEEVADDILEIARQVLVEESDPEVILKVIMALNTIVSREEAIFTQPQLRDRFISTLINELLPSQLRWRAGRSAESIRTMATSLLFLLCPRPLPPSMPPLILSLMEDASTKTRHLSLAVLTKCASLPQFFMGKTFSNTVSCVLKRLDDCDRKVREMSVQTLSTLFEEAGKRSDVDIVLNKSLLEFTFNTLLIHLDDQDHGLQIVVLDALKVIGKLDRALLLEKIHVEKFRDKDIAKELIECFNVVND